jgi:hypothetical protein
VTESLLAAGAPALTDSFMATTGLQQLRKTLPDSYFAHEFLPMAWQPRYVTQVRTDMARIGLVPAGSATMKDNFDSFVLGRRARAAMAGMADGDLRELVRDYFLNQRFRCDVFVRGARLLGDRERATRLSECVFDLQRPVDLVDYAIVSEGRRVGIDSRPARAIVAALRPGPKRLADIPRAGTTRADMLANALALFAADDIRPVGPASADVGRLNAALLGLSDATDAPRYVAVPPGTAVKVPLGMLNALRDGGPVRGRLRPWSEFLGRYRMRPPA